MCLNIIYPKTKRNTLIAKKTFPLIAYKIIHDLNPYDTTRISQRGFKEKYLGKGVYSGTSHCYFHEGTNVNEHTDCPFIRSNDLMATYESGFHCFLTLHSAKKQWAELCWRSELQIKKIIIKKPEHIVAIGTENKRVVLVVKEFTFAEEK